MRGNNKVKNWFLLTLLLLVFFEVSSYFTGRLLQKKWWMWPVSYQTREITYEEYLARRDPLLGWPYPMQYGRDLDINGAQKNPYFPDGGMKGNSAITLYGDSFTQGGDTSDLSKNWGNVLSNKINQYVANYGMGGYGTDQALLRFERNSEDQSPIVLFGVHPGNIIRNLTRARHLETGKVHGYAFKPRFILNEKNELELVPIPKLTERERLQLSGLIQPPLKLKHENLYPNGPAGVVPLRFPYTWSVVRNIGYYGFQSRLWRIPESYYFYKPEHPLKGLAITAKITERFVQLALERKQSPFVIILPHPEEISYFVKTGIWTYQPLLDEFKRTKMPYDDFGPFLLQIAEKEQVELEQFYGPTLHYNDAGNALVAEFVHQALTERNLLPLK